MLSSLTRLARSVHVRKGPAESKYDTHTAEILAEIAHEMRQPLTAALAAFDVLRSGAVDAHPQTAWGVLDRQFKRLARLLDDLSEATRTGVNVKHLRLEQLDLRDVVNEAAQAIRSQLARKRHRLAVDLPAAPVLVEADWARLQQVLSNLLLNGTKYTPAGGALTIRLTHDAGRAVLAVSDTGRGIPAELLQKVFDPFVSGDRPGGRGLGVGLAVAREFVELHGGTIHATSPGVGRGSEFVVTLPAQPHGSHPDVQRGSDSILSARA